METVTAEELRMLVAADPLEPDRVVHCFLPHLAENQVHVHPDAADQAYSEGSQESERRTSGFLDPLLS
jgi:hypothetical protein